MPIQSIPCVNHIILNKQKRCYSCTVYVGNCIIAACNFKRENKKGLTLSYIRPNYYMGFIYIMIFVLLSSIQNSTYHATNSIIHQARCQPGVLEQFGHNIWLKYTFIVQRHPCIEHAGEERFTPATLRLPSDFCTSFSTTGLSVACQHDHTVQISMCSC